MVCSKFKEFKGCGRCQLSIFDDELVKIMSVNYIVKLGAILVNLPNFVDTYSNDNKLKNVYVYCNKNIRLDTQDGTKYISYHNIREVYILLLTKWLAHNKELNEMYSTKQVSKIAEQITNDTSFRRLRHISIRLVKVIESITTCNGNCDTIVPNKEITKCIFKVSDINKICKFSAEGAVDIICTILCTFTETSNNEMFLNLDSTFVQCNGNIFCTTQFIECKSIIYELRSFILRYLDSWCKYNNTETTTIGKMQICIRTIASTNSIELMYDTCMELLEIV